MNTFMVEDKYGTRTETCNDIETAEQYAMSRAGRTLEELKKVGVKISKVDREKPQDVPKKPKAKE